MFDKSKKSFKNYYGKISDGLIQNNVAKIDGRNKRSFIERMRYSGNICSKFDRKNKNFDNTQVLYYKNIQMNEENTNNSLEFLKFLSPKKKLYINIE